MAQHHHHTSLKWKVVMATTTTFLHRVIPAAFSTGNSWNQYKANIWVVLHSYFFLSSPPKHTPTFIHTLLYLPWGIKTLFIPRIRTEAGSLGWTTWPRARKRSVAEQEIQSECPELAAKVAHSCFVSLSDGQAVDLVQGQIRQEIVLSPASLLFGRRRKAAEERGRCLPPSLICFLLASKTTQCMVVYYYYHCYFPECCKTRG